MNSIKKLCTFFFIFTAALIVTSVFCNPTVSEAKANSSNTGCTVSGYKAVKYKKVKTYHIKDKDITSSIVSLMKTLSEKTGDSTQYKVVISPGTHSLSRTIHLPSNVFLYAKGARINMTSDGAPNIISSRKDKKTKNIIIYGGTWSTMRQTSEAYMRPSVIKFMGTSNLKILGASFVTKRFYHIMEIADAHHVSISECSFSGNDKARYMKTSIYSLPKEAIQVDIADVDAMGDTYRWNMYSGKGCHNIVISSCKFVNCARGIGSHSELADSSEKNPYTNITVKGCKFTNLSGEAIYARDWSNCYITQNTIHDSYNAGVYFYEGSYNKVTSNNIGVVKRYTGICAQYFGPLAYGIQVNSAKHCYIDSNTVSGALNGKILRFPTCTDITISNMH